MRTRSLRYAGAWLLAVIPSICSGGADASVTIGTSYWSSSHATCEISFVTVSECWTQFPKIAAGTALIADRITCTISVKGRTSFATVSAGAKNKQTNPPVPPLQFLDAPTQVAVASGDTENPTFVFQVNSAVRLPFSAGQAPMVYVSTADPVGSIFLNCTLAGTVQSQ